MPNISFTTSGIDEPITDNYPPSANPFDVPDNQSDVLPPGQRSELYWDWMETVTRALFIYAPPTLLLLGFLGNSLSLLVMLRKSMRETSVGIYCATLAVADSFAAQGVLLDQMVRGVTSNAVRLHSWLGGTIYLFTTYVGAHTAAWVIVAISTDRFISIWFPLRAKALITTFRSKIVVFVIIVTSVVFNGLHVFILYKGYNTNLNDTTDIYIGINQEVTTYLNVSWYIVDAAVYYILPVPAIFVFNSLIIYRLVINHTKRKAMLPAANTVGAARKAVHVGEVGEEKIYVMLVVVSGVFIMSVLPHYVLAIFSGFVEASDVQTSSIRYFLRQLFISFWCINHSVNFYLYCMTGRKFRSELVKMFRVRKRKSRQDSRECVNNQSDAVNTVTSSVASSFVNLSVDN